MSGNSTFAIMIFESVILSLINIGLIKAFSEGEVIGKTMKGVITLLTIVCVYMAMRFSIRPIADLIFGCLLIVTGGVDYKTKTIVVGLTLLLGFLAAGTSLFYVSPSFDPLWGGVFGFGFYLAIYWGAKAYYKKEAFGYGDVIFMGIIGVYLGFQNAVLASLMTFYVALLFVVVFSIIGKLTSRKAEVAFAPYMALSAWIVSYYGKNLIELYVNLFIK